MAIDFKKLALELLEDPSTAAKGEVFKQAGVEFAAALLEAASSRIPVVGGLVSDAIAAVEPTIEHLLGVDDPAGVAEHAAAAPAPAPGTAPAIPFEQLVEQKVKEALGGLFHHAPSSAAPAPGQRVAQLTAPAKQPIQVELTAAERRAQTLAGK